MRAHTVSVIGRRCSRRSHNDTHAGSRELSNRTRRAFSISDKRSRGGPVARVRRCTTRKRLSESRAPRRNLNTYRPLGVHALALASVCTLWRLHARACGGEIKRTRSTSRSRRVRPLHATSRRWRRRRIEQRSFARSHLTHLAAARPHARTRTRAHTRALRAHTCLRYLIVVHLARPSDPYNLRSAYDRRGFRVSLP